MVKVLDVLDKLHDAVYFTSLDLRSGFHQVELDEDSIPKTKTAFSTHDSHWEWLRCPFGLKNLPADFSRIMFMIFGDLPFAVPYIDDLILFSKTFEEHLEPIKIVLERLKEANLKLNLKKCVWCTHQVKILGHVVSHNIIMMDPEKVEIIKNWPIPTNVKGLQQFLGLANYYRRLIVNFSKIALPLYALFKKDSVFNFSEECLKAFNELKRLLTSNPVLRPPDFNKRFILFCDASNYCLGAILSQRDDEGREYVISYASRMLKETERKYSISEKECLSVIWSTRYFRVYLYGKQFDLSSCVVMAYEY
jgi:hypothetical protein